MPGPGITTGLCGATREISPPKEERRRFCFESRRGWCAAIGPPKAKGPRPNRCARHMGAERGEMDRSGRGRVALPRPTPPDMRTTSPAVHQADRSRRHRALTLRRPIASQYRFFRARLSGGEFDMRQGSFPLPAQRRASWGEVPTTISCAAAPPGVSTQSISLGGGGAGASYRSSRM